MCRLTICTKIPHLVACIIHIVWCRTIVFGAHQVVDFYFNSLHPLQEVPHFAFCRLTVHLPFNFLNRLFRQLILHRRMERVLQCNAIVRNVHIYPKVYTYSWVISEMDLRQNLLPIKILIEYFNRLGTFAAILPHIPNLFPSFGFFLIIIMSMPTGLYKQQRYTLVQDKEMNNFVHCQ